MLKLARQQILLGQSVATKADAIALLAGKLTDAGLVEAGYVDGMLAREAQHATYLGSGIAIPHGRAPTLDRPRGALLRLATPVDFGGEEPVDLVFAMAVPAHYTHQHLMLLSELAELFSAPDIRQALREAGDARALREALDMTPPASAA